ncbi:MAG: hypothetical protein CMH63_02930 [Nanoarchaeota archaeon]|mgnify:CR=1 FL=1|jgi:hypothetical protein|nr:hypothetical protein [Nanoarchaeota archaeon]|tara:strand:- start:8335 stop:9309 length:975 start_codon:yes stop_codon:yes gene_type:complete
MANKIHFWQFPKKEIYILLDKEFRRLLTEKSMTNSNSKNYYQLSLIINKQSQKYNLQTKFNGGDIKRWIRGKNKDNRTDIVHPKFMPLWVLLELNKLAKIDLKEIEKHIIGYKSGLRGKIIINPRLPIKITPEFDSLIIHLFADGYVNNKISSPNYCQKNKEDRQLFIDKLKNTFGDFEETLVENKTIRFPKAITRILSQYYNIPSYLSKKAVIPSRMLSRNKSYKLVCIIAFILDEGSINDGLYCFNTNKILISQIRNLFKECGYECNPLRYGSGSYWFGMKNRFINQFYEDVIRIQKKYPTCSLGSKHEKLHKLYIKPRSGR